MSALTTTTNKIDVLYPIAGQENSSQGFRDNFLNIQLSLITAASELTFLQNDSVSKTSINNDMGGNQLSNVNLTNLGITAVNGQTVTLSSTLVYYDHGSYQEFTQSADTTYVVYNWRDTGAYCPLRLVIKGQYGNRISFAGAVGSGSIVYCDQYLPYQLSGSDITVWDMWSSDGGATIYVTKIGAAYGIIA